jgi:hypothetical protein
VEFFWTHRIHGFLHHHFGNIQHRRRANGTLRYLEIHGNRRPKHELLVARLFAQFHCRLPSHKLEVNDEFLNSEPR